MSVDPIANALTALKNSENATKGTCKLQPASKLLEEILRVMKENGYITGYERVNTKGSGFYKIQLSGKVNECRAIKPRYPVQKDEFEKFEKRYLPSRDVGIIIVSTSKGVLSHKKAKEEGIGGRLIAFVY
ncbi:30S ribosomal protein S8 [Candidatus Micrarchaeota archaeon]|nr:30S ribosomal protein S8 [Candidatus Micrarchaeota archaeon]MBU1930745.1 30S ribosomal protein S8 [Candidatus Micrarchaeota archaeon]